MSLLGIQLCAFPEQCVHLIEKQSLNVIRILPASLVSIDDSHKIFFFKSLKCITSVSDVLYLISVSGTCF